MNKWILQHREVLFSNEYIELIKDSAVASNNLVIPDYYSINTRHAVIVVALDKDLNIVLKREYRHPLNDILIELPAGTIEEDESDGLSVAKRELKEETGYISNDWTYLGTYVESPSKTNTEISLYLAQNSTKASEQSLDESEDIEVLIVPFNEAVEMCMNNTIRVNSSISGIFRVARLLNI